jgi:hypothetical protein
VLAERTTRRIDPSGIGPEAPLEPRSDQPLRPPALGVLRLKVRRRAQNQPDVLLPPGIDRPIERVHGRSTFGRVARLPAGHLCAKSMLGFAFLDRCDRDILEVRAPVGRLLLEPQRPAFFAIAIV